MRIIRQKIWPKRQKLDGPAGEAEFAGLESAGLENDVLEKQNLIRNQIPHLNLS